MSVNDVGNMKGTMGMRRIAVALAFASGLALAANADVTCASDKMTIDGRLDEPCWAKAEWNGGFVKLANRVKDREVDAQTSFAILADSSAVYVAIKCDEREMADLKARPASGLYNCDNVELFLSPRGDGFDFYQFVVAFNPHSGVDGADARYASEGGNITPDPYGPEWSFARGETEDGWCVEIAIPFSSFYMSRNVEWRDTWCVNVARQRGVGKSELTTWSPLQVKFGEPDRFRKISGFPKRSDADDVGITDVVAEMTGRQNDKLIGTLSFATAVAVDGEYEVSSPYASTTAVRLKSGVNAVRVPCAYSSNGRFPTKISLKRMATDEIYSRTYPVSVDFEDVRVKLTSPEYRDNFYPGQDSSHVKGRVETACDGEVALTLAGPGFQKCEARLPRGGGEFDFDTSGFKDGTAVLSVAAGGMIKVFKIRKLAKTARRMSWISQGRLVVDGKPVLRRGIYAKGYMGGKAFAEKFDSDKRLYMTPEVSQGGTLEPGRVIKGLEAREARKDIVPCKEYFDKIDAMIEASKEKDFAYWYISDEPECRGLSQVYLRHVYEHMKEKDPYHVVLTATRAGKQYLDCADWFETHPYINPRDDGRGNRILDRPMSSIGDFLDAFDAQNHPDKCVGFLPTMFAYRYASILNDYPTFQEYVCHVWAAMMRGSKTLWPFFYWDMGDRAALYEGNRYVNSTFASLDDFILDGKRTTLFKTKDAECVRWDLENGESMFAFANFTNKRLDMALPKGLEDRKWHPFRGQWAEGRALEPYEVVVGTTDERGTDLETYAEAQKLVDGQEYERTHRDNQILEKYLAVEATSSNGKVRLYKLVDGIHDVLGWLAKGKDHWAEFSFTDNPVIFSRVRVYGSGLDGMKVSIRKGGEWKELEPKAVKTEKYMRELDFGTVESTVKMRLSFSAATVELYELEIPRVSGNSLRVGTWNIRNSKGDEGTENSWERRRDDVVSLIKKLDVDVIGLQEVLPDQAEFLKASLPDYAFVGDHRGVDRKTDEASPVVYRKNRFQEKSSGTFWLSETPEVPASKSWQTACPRVCSYVVLVDKTTGKRFCFANTHTDHSSELAREKGMMLIVERMKKFGEGAPIVFVGDHNCSYGTKPAAEVRAVLLDTRDIAREVSGPSYTFHAFGKREVGPIDYVYVSRDIDVLDLVAYGDKCKDGSHYPSDHFPLTSTIAWGM